MKNSIPKLLLSLMITCSLFVVALSHPAFAVIKLDKIHFIIPGGAGGGWDGTARGTGEALTKSGLLKKASYENLSGGGGGKAIGHLIETAERQQHTLMVNSTPIVVRSLTKVFPFSFRDLTPIASIISDYGALVVAKDSKFKNWNQVVKAFLENPKKVKVAGGSVRGDMDHLVAAMAFKAAGGNPRAVRYIPYEAGGKAMAGLLSGETQILSTGFGEALALARAGEVRIIAVTSEKRLPEAPDVPSLKELGYNVTFANWRGFFAPPGISAKKALNYARLLKAMYSTPEWEAVRKRQGWSNLYQPGVLFYEFLEEQEKVVGSLMRELGFLK
ncbi:MAG: tripartite tricarboxylate transporter substrate binding protein [Deltaproteobacteria bacterium]|jgi:putative tricarboxylic transport membrane protein|nr:tripartite tricarboxylate transporter substrate binding protein [Deltaproteobacteria bacterium]MBT6504089.1 tripartite tricarboxylate transporter substrate binding protein [Deltaproteobacteria bacterium]MBT7153030.1 tripartite tricarboxylate transporter substrate binding protein [Deltaproteobacteria bacterium]MBT7888139.1 tripartite tricarboxylate transporter substrate binding protein [Deltaproteobacteria bacterium]